MDEIKKPIKSGFIYEPVQPEDWLFGSSGLDTEVKILTGDWTQFLPKNEKQRQGFESMCCTNFSSTSAVEILMTRLIELKLMSVANLYWLNEKGYIDDSGHINFSDRFDALVSGTNPNTGNTLKAPADAKHKYGLIPEKLLPWTDNEADYFDNTKITPQMYTLGQEFLKHFSINYEMVYAKDYQIALKISPLASALFAWNGVVNNIYQTTNNSFNHAIAIIKPPTYWEIFDSYDPFTKLLADNYAFMGYAIRYIITENQPIPETQKKNMYLLRRNPSDKNEVFALSEDLKFKRHIVNKETLQVGAVSKDQYWVWEKDIDIPVATPVEFGGAEELAEILLLPKDSDIIISTGQKLSFWQRIKRILGIKN